MEEDCLKQWIFCGKMDAPNIYRFCQKIGKKCKDKCLFSTMEKQEENLQWRRSWKGRWDL